jgi:ATP-binding cassette, subfamily B, bacterial MsbA
VIQLNPLRRLDPRLLAELRTQRKPILLGLFCVVVSTILTLATVPLIAESIRAIRLAAPVALTVEEARRVERKELLDLADQIAPALGVPRDQARQAVDRMVEEHRVGRHELRTALLARELGVPETAVRRAIEETNGLPTGDRSAVERLAFISALVVAVFGIKYWFTRGQMYFLAKASNRLATDLRRRLFAKLQRLPVTYFNKKRAGSVYSVLTNDVAVYQTAVSIVRDSIDAPLRAAGALILIAYYQWQLGLIAILFVPVLVAIIQRNAKRMRTAQRDVQDDLGDLGAMAHEALQGTRVVKAFSAEERIEQNYEGLLERSFSSQMRAAKRIASLRPLVELTGASVLALILYVCGWLAYGGTLQIEHILAIIYSLDVINQGFKSMGNVRNTLAQVEAASDRIYGEILDVPPEEMDGAATRTLPNPQGRIEFRNVSFQYEDGTLALRNVSFVLEPGTSLALVGPSGAGKSTIADLILRFYEPTEGQILFDGVDVRELKASWLRSQIGVVPQHTFLFAGSIAENIRLGASGATEEDIRDAARAAHADEFVKDLPNGFETEIGERGVGLSGGQAQRVAIARAIARKPTILLLDEATSALDASSEKAVQQALDEIMRTRTTLFIAHRLTTAARADRILYLRGGEVVEYGSHRELVASNGEYAALFRVFSGGVLDEKAGLG